MDEFEFYSIYKVLDNEIREKKYSIEISYILMIFNKNRTVIIKREIKELSLLDFLLIMEKSYTI